MNEAVLSEYHGEFNSLYLTDNSLHFYFGEGTDKLFVDLMAGKHKFFVRYHDVDFILAAEYITEKEKQHIPVETGIIEWLQHQKLVHSVKLHDIDTKQSPRMPQECLMTVNLKKTIAHMANEALESKEPQS